MIIYAVVHNYDNGESYEDYREYKDVYLFETYEKANTFFWDKVTSDYQGKYSLYDWELDTQKQNLLDESEWITCTPCYYDYYNQNDYEEDEDYQEPNDEFQPQLDKEAIEDYLYTLPNIQEQIVEEEWLKHKGENYEILHQIEEDKLEDELKASEEAFKLLGMI